MAHVPIYTGDMTASTWVLDFSSLVLAPPFEAGTLTVWDAIAKSVDGTNARKYEWIAEENMQNTLELDEDLDTTETAITFAAGEIAAAGLRAGALLRNATDRTLREVIQVATVDSATVATVVRDYGGHVSGSGGGTTGEAHATTDALELIGYSNFQGSSIQADTYDKFAVRDRSLAYNYYTILDDRTQMAASEMKSVYRGNYSNNWAYQVAGMVDRFRIQQEKTLCFSPMVEATASVRSAMGGLYWFATQATQTTAKMWDQTAEDFSYSVWDNAIKAMYTKDASLGNGDLITLVPLSGLQSAAYIHESAQRMEYLSETTRGLYATHLQSTVLPKPIALVPTLNIPSDSFMIINLKAQRVHFLEGRGLVVYNQPVGDNLADRTAQRWISEMTLESQRPTENIYFHDNITFPTS